MRVLQLHNRYQHRGGEDVVVDSEFDLLKEQGIHCEQLIFDNDQVAPLAVFNNSSSQKALKEKIHSFKPDVIHAHNLFYKASPGILDQARKEGVPVVMTLHNFRLICPNAMFMRQDTVCTKCLKKKLALPAIRYGCFKDSRVQSAVLASALSYHNLRGSWTKNVDRFLVLTPFIRDLILSSSLGLDPGKVEVKPNSTDDILELIPSADRKGPYVFVGRLSAEKGVEVLIDAFNQMPELKLSIIGEGPLKEKLEQQAGPNIDFKGARSRQYVKNALSKTPALLFSSVIFEGLPNTIIEAFAAGTPVIASDVDNINQIVTPGANGCLFKTKNVEDLINSVRGFEANREQSLYQGARSTYLKKYTHQQNYNALISVYRSVIKNDEKENS